MTQSGNVRRIAGGSFASGALHGVPDLPSFILMV
jgi:hypothetical protein